MKKNSLHKKLSVFLAFAATAGFLVPIGAGGITIQEIENQLDDLKNQLAQLESVSGALNMPAACASVAFSRNLKIGSFGSDVTCLQAILNQNTRTRVAVSGPGSLGRETSVFGFATRRAVVAFQKEHKILQTGMVGPLTRGMLEEILSLFKAAAAPSSPAPAPAVSVLPQPPLSQSDMTVAAITKAAPSVVSIVVSRQVPEYQVVYQDPFGNGLVSVPIYQPTGRTVLQRVGAGTGFLVTSSGYIVTNKHVVVDSLATYTATLASGVQQPLIIVHRDPQQDLAILKMEGSGYPIISLGNSAGLQLGQPIIAIGNALGQLSNSVSLGIISGLERTISVSDSSGAVQTLTGTIQTDAAINPGNSGGPLLDLWGRAVGITVAMAEGSNNISFAVPIDAVSSVIKSVAGISSGL